MPWYKEAIGWVEEHPWATGGIVLGVGIVIILIYESSGSSSPKNNLSFNQQYKLQKLQGGQQLAALRIQESPALASTRAGTAQAGIAARAQTAGEKIGAGVTNLQTTTAGSEAENSQIAQLDEALSSLETQQEQNYLNYSSGENSLETGYNEFQAGLPLQAYQSYLGGWENDVLAGINAGANGENLTPGYGAGEPYPNYSDL
jgi:hypothetical protein